MYMKLWSKTKTHTNIHQNHIHTLTRVAYVSPSNVLWNLRGDVVTGKGVATVHGVVKFQKKKEKCKMHCCC